MKPVLQTCFSVFFLSLLFNILLPKISVAQSLVWQKVVGGNGEDSLTAMSVGKNQTFVVCGCSKSAVSGNKSEPNLGGFDYWVVKMDFAGNVLWNKTFGGAKDDMATAIIHTTDGGYLVGGYSISETSATKSSISYKQSNDYWVLKLDANGNKVWDKTYGGVYTDKLTTLAQLPNGNYVAGGYSFSAAGGMKTPANIGSENTADFWLLTLAADGSVLSQKVYGGTSHDVVNSVLPAGGNDVYAFGYSYSNKYTGYKTVLPAGNNDYWFVRTDAAGAIKYEGGFGGDRSEFLTSAQMLPDSSLILGGYSNSPASSSKSGSFLGVTDYWIVKTTTGKAKLWDKTIGGAGGDYLTSVQPTADGGFLLGGYSNSNKGFSKGENSKGGFDYWIVKTNSAGDMMWNRTLGGSGNDMLVKICEIAPNQYIAAGTSSSPKSGSKTSGTVGASGAGDFWVLRLNGPASLTAMETAFVSNNIAEPNKNEYILDASPNPASSVMTVRYRVPEAKKGTLVLYSSTGVELQNVHCLFPVHYPPVTLNVATLPKGAYHLVMYTGNKQEVLRKTVLKQ